MYKGKLYKVITNYTINNPVSYNLDVLEHDTQVRSEKNGKVWIVGFINVTSRLGQKLP